MFEGGLGCSLSIILKQVVAKAARVAFWLILRTEASSGKAASCILVASVFERGVLLSLALEKAAFFWAFTKRCRDGRNPGILVTQPVWSIDST